jgi:large subunit ribosomal protein L25
MTELDITCLPADLPEYIEVDVAEVEVGQILHISDIKLPNGVESIALSYGEDRDSPIFTVNKPKEEVEEVIVDEDSEETVENENKEGDESDEKNE